MNASNTSDSSLSSTATLSLLNTMQLLTSALTPGLELARIFFSVFIFILVHFSPLYRKTSFGFHMRCFAIYDACRISERLFYWFPPLSLFMIKYKYSRCNIAFFLQNFFSHLSIVTIVILSIERCIILWLPLRARYWTSMRNAIITQSISFASMLIVTHFYLLPNYFSSMDYARCYYPKIFHVYHEGLIFNYRTYSIVDIFLFSLIPCTLTAISVVFIIIGLKRQKRRQQYLRSNQIDQQPNISIRETSIILVTIAILQVATTFPLKLLVLIKFIIPIDLNLYAALYYLLVFNELLASTVNFVAFVLPFQNIRNEFIRVFFSFCYQKRQKSSVVVGTRRMATVTPVP